jgi:hypothetical protein
LSHQYYSLREERFQEKLLSKFGTFFFSAFFPLAGICSST